MRGYTVFGNALIKRHPEGKGGGNPLLLRGKTPRERTMKKEKG